MADTLTQQAKVSQAFLKAMEGNGDQKVQIFQIQAEHLSLTVDASIPLPLRERSINEQSLEQKPVQEGTILDFYNKVKHLGSNFRGRMVMLGILIFKEELARQGGNITKTARELGMSTVTAWSIIKQIKEEEKANEANLCLRPISSSNGL